MVPYLKQEHPVKGFVSGIHGMSIRDIVESIVLATGFGAPTVIGAVYIINQFLLGRALEVEPLIGIFLLQLPWALFLGVCTTIDEKRRKAGIAPTMEKSTIP